MYQNAPNQVGEIHLPDDLRTDIGEDQLVSIVLDSVQSVSETDDVAPNWMTSLPAGMPRTLLTLLTYGYAAGILASGEIEARIPSDPTMRYLAAGIRPTWHDLRRFRRQNRRFVHKALSKAFELAFNWQFQHPATANVTRTLPRTLAGDSNSHAERALAIAAAACERISQAVILDSMALDD